MGQAQCAMAIVMPEALFRALSTWFCDKYFMSVHFDMLNFFAHDFEAASLIYLLI